MSKIAAISQRISEIADFKKFTQISCTEERKEFSIIEYKSQAYVVVAQSEENVTIKINDAEVIIGLDDTKLFRVKNAKRVVFIPIDGKNGLLGFGTSYCDAIIFDEMDFCFVEFKFDATSIKKIVKNRADAISQLSNTIDLFDEKLGQDYGGLHLEAYVSTPLFYPRNDASWIKLSVDFLEKYGFSVFEATEKTCK